MNKTIIYSSIAAVIFSVLVVGGIILLIQREDANLVEGEFMEIESVCTKENDGKRITVEGYPRLDDFLTYCGDDCDVDIFKYSNYQEKSLDGNVKVGDGKNHMLELPDEYWYTDMKIMDKNKQQVSYQDKARFTGELEVIDSLEGEPPVCNFNIDLVEKTTAQLEADRYDWNIAGPKETNLAEVCTDSSTDGNLVKTSGYLALDKYVLCLIDNCPVNLHESIGSENPLQTYIDIGNDINQMHKPDSASSDLEVIHYKDNYVDVSKSVNLIGEVRKSGESCYLNVLQIEQE